MRRCDVHRMRPTGAVGTRLRSNRVLGGCGKSSAADHHSIFVPTLGMIGSPGTIVSCEKSKLGMKNSGF